MSDSNKSLASCEFRRPLCPSDAGEVAVCGLLEQLTGVSETKLLEVPEAACSTCLDCFPPTHEDLNPVVASLLFHLTEEVLSRGGVANCTAARARELNEFAEQSLPQIAPDEDDCANPASLPRPDATDVTAEEIERLLPRPARRSGRPVRNWAVGVTTAPRRSPTLTECVDSIRAAGWAEMTLFVDGDVALSDSLGDLPACHRRPAVGAFPNYVLSLHELYMRQPRADAYMLIQDDALFPRTEEVRRYVEELLWPGPRPGIVSLYCSTKYAQPTLGWHALAEPWVWGAVAFIFCPATAKRLLASRRMIRHRAMPGDQGLSRIDVVFGQAAHAMGIPIHFPSPSLVEHIGNVSSIWKSSRAVNNRKADRFIGDLF